LFSFLLVHLGILGHRGNEIIIIKAKFVFFLGIVDLNENQNDLEQGNKLAVLGGDYLLSQACGKLAEFRKPQVK
jgi:hypothetical protein